MLKKVLIISSEPNYPELDPGLSIFAHDWSRHLNKVGIDCDIVSFQKIFFLRLMRKSIPKRVLVKNLGKVSIIPNWTFAAGILCFIRMFKFLIRLKKNNQNYDLIICKNFFWAGFCALRLRRIHNTKVIVIEHNANKIVKNKSCLHSKLYKETVLNNLPRRIFCVSSNFQRDIGRQYKFFAPVVSNMVPVEFMGQVSKVYDPYKLISVGSLDDNKDQRMQIEIMKLLPKEYSLTIIGQGPRFDAINKMIIEQGLKDRVFLKGQKNRLEVRDYLDSSAILLNTSHSETFGVVNIEAGSRGLHIISYTNGGVLDSTLEINTTVLNDRNPDNWALNILKLRKTGIDRSIVGSTYQNKFSDIHWLSEVS